MDRNTNKAALMTGKQPAGAATGLCRLKAQLKPSLVGQNLKTASSHQSDVRVNYNCNEKIFTVKRSIVFVLFMHWVLCKFKRRGPKGPWVAHLRKRSKVTVEPFTEDH